MGAERRTAARKSASMADSTARRAGGAAIVVLWTAALLFRSIGTCSEDVAGAVKWWENGVVVLIGWLGPFRLEFGWWANIPIFVSAVTLLRGRVPKPWIVAVGAALAASALWPVRLPYNEGGTEWGKVCAFGLGFWLWFACSLIPGLFVLPLRRRPRSPAKP